MDLINTGRKLKQLRVERNIPQAALGQKAFGKSSSAAQTQIRKIELGDWKKFNQDDLEIILKILDVDMEEFLNMPVPEDDDKKEKLCINGEEVPQEFLDIWPAAPKYFRMLKDAQDANDKPLQEFAIKRMVASLQEQAAAYQESADSEKE